MEWRNSVKLTYLESNKEELMMYEINKEVNTENLVKDGISRLKSEESHL